MKSLELLSRIVAYCNIEGVGIAFSGGFSNVEDFCSYYFGTKKCLGVLCEDYYYLYVYKDIVKDCFDKKLYKNPDICAWVDNFCVHCFRIDY